MTHTPTPWKFVPWHIAEGPAEVRTTQGPGASSTGWIICTTSSDDDAAFIVKAANSHDDLVVALSRAERKLLAYVGICKGDKELTDTILPMVRAALSQEERT